MEKNICVLRVQLKWAKTEWHVLNKHGHHIQEFDPGVFETYFERTSKEEALWYAVMLRKTIEEQADLGLVWNEEENRWRLFDLKTGQLVKNVFGCDKIPQIFPAALKDQANYYAFRSKIIKVREEAPADLSGSYNLLTA